MVIIIFNMITNIIWFITTIFIMYAGFYFSIKLKFPQFRWIKILKSLKGANKEIFKTLNLTLAGKIGVGSISGIALCMYVGGVGSIFWLWISTFILTSLTCIETKLGLKYRKKIKNEYIGGPSFYIEHGLKNKKLSQIYSVLIILAYIVAFISIQTNTIIIALENIVDIDKLLIVFFLIIIIMLSIRNGVSTISKITEILTPVMGTIYILTGILVISINYKRSIEAFQLIILNAFSFKSIISIPVIVGIERGIFANEVGIGTTAMAVSASNDNDIERIQNIQIIGTFLTSLIICTITTFIILTSNGFQNNTLNINGIEIVNFAFLQHFGYYGTIILTIIIFLFAFSTIITSYYYGELNFKQLFNKNTKILKIIVIIIIAYSSYAKPLVLWNVVDILVALIAIINSYAMIKLSKKE